VAPSRLLYGHVRFTLSVEIHSWRYPHLFRCLAVRQFIETFLSSLNLSETILSISLASAPTIASHCRRTSDPIPLSRSPDSRAKQKSGYERNTVAGGTIRQRIPPCARAKLMRNRRLPVKREFNGRKNQFQEFEVRACRRESGEFTLLRNLPMGSWCWYSRWTWGLWIRGSAG
jgi:hypothetical protein